VQPGVHPGFNQRVADLAVEIARSSPEYIAEAGYVPAHEALTPMDGGGADCPAGAGGRCAAARAGMGGTGDRRRAGRAAGRGRAGRPLAGGLGRAAGDVPAAEPRRRGAGDRGPGDGPPAGADAADRLLAARVILNPLDSLVDTLGPGPEPALGDACVAPARRPEYPWRKRVVRRAWAPRAGPGRPARSPGRGACA